VRDEQLLELWRRARTHLSAARLSLPDSEASGLEWADEFLDHNELGLALDQLADVAGEQDAPRSVWDELQAAATVIATGWR
jgi:hypothetical protein